MINSAETTRLENQLESERKDLLAKIEKIMEPVSFGDDVDGFEEKTDESEEYSNQVAEAQALKERLEEIEIALGKIKNNAFGKCENCQTEIPIEVLDADPALRWCLTCRK